MQYAKAVGSNDKKKKEKKEEKKRNEVSLQAALPSVSHFHMSVVVHCQESLYFSPPPSTQMDL